MRSCLSACALAWFFLVPVATHAQQATADKKGNVWYTDAAGKRTRLTTDGKNSDPALSPDKRRIAYVHEVPGKAVSTGAGDGTPTDLCVMDIDGKNAQALVHSAEGKETEDILADFSSPSWSPDGRTLYFGSAAWATSGSIHAYDFEKKAERYVMPGNGPQVVPAGEYKGHLLVEQHRYFLGGGSFDWYWLFTPEGKEVGPVGETTDGFREMYFEEEPKPAARHPKSR